MSGLLVGLINSGSGSGTDLTGVGTDNRVARWDGTDTIQSSGWSLADTDVLTAGGNLDMNGNDVLVPGIKFSSGEQQILFSTAISPVNYLTIGNSATGQPVTVASDGSDTNVDLSLSAKGTGNISLGNYTFDGDGAAGAGQDNYVLTYDNGTGLISLEAAASGGISNVVEDTTPQLGGTLDANGNDINMGGNNIIYPYEIHDFSGNPHIRFIDLGAGAVNYLSIGNRATGNGPYINASGSDTNINLELDAKGTGTVLIGNSDLDMSGNAIQNVATIDLQTEAIITEMVDHVSTPTAGFGILWVRNDTPNVLVFTDDAGTDTVLGSGGGLTAVVDDTTPQLGGMLDVNGQVLGDGTLELLAFTETASAVNHLNVTNAATGNGPTLSAVGDDVNVDLNLSAKGTGDIALGNFTFDGDATVGAGQDNYVLTYDNGTGLISLEAATGGGIANVVEDTTPQLGGMLDVNGNALGDGTLELLTFTETASAVNHINITNNITANDPTISGAGDDANVGITIDTKGTSSTLRLNINGTSKMTVTNTACNSLQAHRFSDGTVSSPGISFTSDSDTGIYRPAANQVGLAVQADEALLLNSASASAVNYLQVNNAITGNGPELVAAGDDTNIDLELIPKGTGEVIIADCEFSGGVAYQSTALASGAGTKTMDGNTAADYTYEQSGASPTFAAPTNVIVGQRFSLEITDTTGSGSITWNACFEWEGGTAPAALSAGETRQIDFRVAAVSGTTATRVSGFYSGAIS